jgi:hypothetical protein
VASNPEQPRLEVCGNRGSLGARPKQCKEDIVCNLLGILAVPESPECEPKDPIGVAPDESLHRFLVPGSRPLKECRVRLIRLVHNRADGRYLPALTT